MVIGLGGYSSGAVVLIAALRGIPTLVLEQNALPGITNRLLARFAAGGGGVLGGWGGSGVGVMLLPVPKKKWPGSC